MTHDQDLPQFGLDLRCDLGRTTQGWGFSLAVDHTNANQSPSVDAKVARRLIQLAVNNALGPPTSILSCAWKGRAAAVATSADGVAFATSGILGTTAAGEYNVVTFTMTTAVRGVLRIYGEFFEVTFNTESDAKEFRSVVDRGREERLAARGGGPLQVGPEDRLLSACTYIGGAYLLLEQGALVDLAFRENALEIYGYPAMALHQPVQVMPFSGSFSLELTGPGRVTQGGGFIGGGFGLMGAMEGMAIATFLNRITTTHRITTVIILADHHHEGFFVNTTATPEDLRRALSPIFVRLRQYKEAARPELTPSYDLISRLERLSVLHSSGVLTDTEFTTAKAALLTGT